MPRKPKTKLKKKKYERPTASLEERTVLEFDLPMLQRYLHAHFLSPVSELRKNAADESINAGESMIITAMLRIRDTGDIYALNALLDRLVGPVMRKIQLTGERPYENWTLEELEAEHRRLNQNNRHTIDMIHKERKLIALVQSGQIRPGDYIAPKEVKEVSETKTEDVPTAEYVASGIGQDSDGKQGKA